MTGLETAFYIVGIVTMGLMLLMMMALLAAVLVIKAKINKVHDMVTEKVDKAKSVASNLTMGLDFLRRLMSRG